MPASHAVCTRARAPPAASPYTTASVPRGAAWIRYSSPTLPASSAPATRRRPGGRNGRLTCRNRIRSRCPRRASAAWIRCVRTPASPGGSTVRSRRAVPSSSRGCPAPVRPASRSMRSRTSRTGARSYRSTCATATGTVMRARSLRPLRAPSAVLRVRISRTTTSSQPRPSYSRRPARPFSSTTWRTRPASRRSSVLSRFRSPWSAARASIRARGGPSSTPSRGPPTRSPTISAPGSARSAPTPNPTPWRPSRPERAGYPSPPSCSRRGSHSDRVGGSRTTSPRPTISARGRTRRSAARLS